MKYLYSCKQCGVKDREVEVPIKLSDTMAKATKKLEIAVGADHMAQSPRCGAKELRNVRVIPESIPTA